MNSNTGKMLAGCGCGLWLLCVVVIVIAQVLLGSGMLNYSLAAPVAYTTYGAGCCSSLGFIVGVVGIILIFVGKKAEEV